ncbi:hypothetical protein D5282_13890 [bacterium 1xD8-48]|nr:hypothetical protein [bacterium 1xD8-48]
MYKGVSGWFFAFRGIASFGLWGYRLRFSGKMCRAFYMDIPASTERKAFFDIVKFCFLLSAGCDSLFLPGNAVKVFQPWSGVSYRP